MMTSPRPSKPDGDSRSQRARPTLLLADKFGGVWTVCITLERVPHLGMQTNLRSLAQTWVMVCLGPQQRATSHGRILLGLQPEWLGSKGTMHAGLGRLLQPMDLAAHQQHSALPLPNGLMGPGSMLQHRLRGLRGVQRTALLLCLVHLLLARLLLLQLFRPGHGTSRHEGLAAS